MNTWTSTSEAKAVTLDDLKDTCRRISVMAEACGANRPAAVIMTPDYLRAFKVYCGGTSSPAKSMFAIATVFVAHTMDEARKKATVFRLRRGLDAEILYCGYPDVEGE